MAWGCCCYCTNRITCDAVLQPACQRQLIQASHDPSAKRCNAGCMNMRSIGSSKTPWCLHNGVEVPSMSCGHTPRCFNSLEEQNMSNGTHGMAVRRLARIV